MKFKQRISQYVFNDYRNSFGSTLFDLSQSNKV